MLGIEKHAQPQSKCPLQRYCFATSVHVYLKCLFYFVFRAVKKSSLRRSKSASSLSLSGTSLLNRSSIREARPIENTKLRKTLSQSQDLSNITATPRVGSVEKSVLQHHSNTEGTVISCRLPAVPYSLHWRKYLTLEKNIPDSPHRQIARGRNIPISHA
jgi:hypothetical protein